MYRYNQRRARNLRTGRDSDIQLIKDRLQELNECEDPKLQFELEGMLDELLRPYGLLLARHGNEYVITE